MGGGTRNQRNEEILYRGLSAEYSQVVAAQRFRSKGDGKNSRGKVKEDPVKRPRRKKRHDRRIPRGKYPKSGASNGQKGGERRVKRKSVRKS